MRQFIYSGIRGAIKIGTRYMSYEKDLKENLDLPHCFELMTNLIKDAGIIVAEASKKKRDFTTKQNSIDLLTQTDQEVQELIICGIKQHYPNHCIIAEEESEMLNEEKQLTMAPTWLIDPIDGTMNFVHGFPYYCISIGFWVNQRPEYGMIYCPMLNSRYYAKRGKGAFLNDDRIKVSGQMDLKKALIMHELGSEINRKRDILANVDTIMTKAHGMRSLGSVAMNMCMLAQGACDGYYEFGSHAWDIAAATLIIREAGGIVLDPCGTKLDIMSRRVLAAATPELAKALSQNLKQMFPHPRDDNN